MMGKRECRIAMAMLLLIFSSLSLPADHHHTDEGLDSNEFPSVLKSELFPDDWDEFSNECQGDTEECLSWPSDRTRAPPKTGILFKPEILEYAHSPVCIPIVSEFVISNNADEEIHVYSIASDSTQFHPVSFQPQTLMPLESLTIQLLFLPYYVKPTDALVTVSTSYGEFEYHIIGNAVNNPYNLHPFVGNKVIAGVPLEQPIVMFNPHDEALHILEIFTTEEFLSLHRISSSENASDSWELDAGAEREVIRLAMSSSIPGHYYGYVHIKTDIDKIVIPVDLQVMEGGLRPVDEVVDFGVITQSKAQKSVEFKLVNSGSSDVSIIDIVPIVSDPQLVVEYQNRLVPAGMEVAVATLKYTGAKPGKFSNKLLVTTDNRNAAYATLEVAYEASVLQGGIGFRYNQSIFPLPIWNHTAVAAREMDAFQNGTVGYFLREFVFTNFFSVPVAIQGISSETCNKIITVLGIPKLVSVGRMESWSPLILLFNTSNAIIQSLSREGLPFTCWLELWTNISSHRIPLHILDGDLNVKLINDKSLQKKSSSISYNRKGQRVATPTESNDNFDIHEIDFNQIGSSVPEGLLFSIENNNPQRIPLYLASTTGPICLCLEALVPLADAGVRTKGNSALLDTLFPNKFIPPKTSADANCTCYETGTSSYSTRVDKAMPRDEELSFKSTFGDFLDPENLADRDHLDKMRKNAVMSRPRRSDANSSAPFLQLKAFHVAYVSLHVMAAVGRGSTVLNMTSPYQSKIFIVNYSMVEGDVRLGVKRMSESARHAGSTIAMGYYQHMDITAESTFNFSVPIRSLTSSSTQFSIPPHLSLPSIPMTRLTGSSVERHGLSDEDSAYSEVVATSSSPVIIGGLVPSFSCLSGAKSPVLRVDGNNGQLQLGFLDSIDLKQKDRKYPAYGCLRQMLARANLHVDKASPGVGFPGAHDIGTIMDLIVKVENSLVQQNWKAAHDGSLKLSEEWELLYPRGFPLRPFNVTLSTDVSLSTAQISDLTVVVPFESIPPVAEVILPVSKPKTAMEFYLKVVNPYDMYLSFSLADTESIQQQQRARAAAPAPTSSASPRLNVVESKRFVPAMYPNSWTPSGCRRYSVHTPRGGPPAPSLGPSLVPSRARSQANVPKRAFKVQQQDITTYLTMRQEGLKSIAALDKKINQANMGTQDGGVGLVGVEDERYVLWEDVQYACEAIIQLLKKDKSQKGTRIEAEMQKFGVNSDTLTLDISTLKSKIRQHKNPMAPPIKSDVTESSKKGADLSSNKNDNFDGGRIVLENGNAIVIDSDDPLNNPVEVRQEPVGEFDKNIAEDLMARSTRARFAKTLNYFDFFVNCTGDCGTSSRGWSGFVKDQEDELFRYPEECSAWAQHSGAPAALSPIVTGALITATFSGSEQVLVKVENYNSAGSLVSPFSVLHAHPQEAVIAPRSTAYIGPIVFDSAYEGVFKRTIYVVNNFTGTDKVVFIGETGKSALVLSHASYLTNSTMDANEGEMYIFPNVTNPEHPFGENPLVIMNGEGGYSVYVYSPDNVGKGIGVDSPILKVTADAGFLVYHLRNSGIMSDTVGDIELNGKKLCSSTTSNEYSELCAQLPLEVLVNSSWSMKLPHYAHCDYESSSILLRVFSNDSTPSLLFETKHDTSLSPSMIAHCLAKRARKYQNSYMLYIVKLLVLVMSLLSVGLFAKRFITAQSLYTSKKQVIEGELIFGGVAEVFLKHAQHEMATATQRGRKTTALGAAIASEGTKKNGKAMATGRQGDPSHYEELIRMDDIDISEVIQGTSPALEGYANYLRRKSQLESEMAGKVEGVMTPTASSTKSGGKGVLSNAIEPTVKVTANVPSVAASSTNQEIEIDRKVERNSMINTSFSPKDTIQATNPVSRTALSLQYYDHGHYLTGDDSISTTNDASEIVPLRSPQRQMAATLSSSDELSKSRPDITVDTSPRVNASSNPFEMGNPILSPLYADSDADFEASDFNMLINRDLRALLEKPSDQEHAMNQWSGHSSLFQGNTFGESSHSYGGSGMPPPPGFGPEPLRKINANALGDNMSKMYDVSPRSTFFDEKEVDDLVRDDVPTLAQDPMLQSFFSGVANRSENKSLGNSGSSRDMFGSRSGPSDLGTSRDAMHQYSGIINFLDTETLPLSLSSASSPAVSGGNLTPQHLRTAGKFSPNYGSSTTGSWRADAGHIGSGTSSTTAHALGPPPGLSNPTRGNLAASLTRPVISEAPHSSGPRRDTSQSQYSSLNAYPYPPLSLDTAIPAAAIPEKSSGGRYTSDSPSSRGLPLAAALSPIIPGSRPLRSSPRIVPAASYQQVNVNPNSKAIPGISDYSSGPVVRSKIAADIRSSTGISERGTHPSGPPPGISSPHYQLNTGGIVSEGKNSTGVIQHYGSGDHDQFFGEGGFFSSTRRTRSGSRGSALSDDILLQSLAAEKD